MEIKRLLLCLLTILFGESQAFLERRGAVAPNRAGRVVSLKIQHPPWRPNKKNNNNNNGSIHHQLQQHSRLMTSNTLRASLPNKSDEKLPSSSDPATAPLSPLLVNIWIVAMSGFIVANQVGRTSCWPGFLTQVPFEVLSLIHSVSGMLFAGSIITTTLLEWMVISNSSKNGEGGLLLRQFWFQHAPRVERIVVLPALTGAIVSGVGQAFWNYGGLALAPPHIKGSFHLLATFGLWWGLTDRTTQGPALKAAMKTGDSVEDEASSSVPRVMYQRLFSNVVSCLFLLMFYGLMVLKPGYLQ